MEEEPIQENLWWAIPHKVCGVRKPSEAEIPQLQASGIGAIVSVMDDPSNLDIYEQIGIPYIWLPVKGGMAPTGKQIETLRKFVEHHNNFGKGVAIHCTSGRRRTGTFLIAYLIAIGKSYEESLNIVLNANPAVELREAQTKFLKQFFSSHLSTNL